MLWSLSVLATVIHWQLLFQVFCTPFSLTKNLLSTFLSPTLEGSHLISYFCHWLPASSLFRGFPLLCPHSLSCFLSASWYYPSTVPLVFSQPLCCSLSFGNWVSWSNASFTGRTQAQNPWLVKVIYEVHGRLGKKSQCFWVISSHSAQDFPSPFRSAGLVIFHLCRIHFSLETIALCFFLTAFDSEFFGNNLNVFVLAKHLVHLYSAT